MPYQMLLNKYNWLNVLSQIPLLLKSFYETSH